MPIEELYTRIYHDVMQHFYPDVYMENQEGDINAFNSFQKKGWKYYRDGGAVKKHTQDYSAYFRFDFKDKESKSKKILAFRSYEKSSGCHLLDFVKSVLAADSKNFVKVENFVSYDARRYLFEVVHISVVGSVIDDLFFQVLRKYFHKVESISFDNCVIKKECNLNHVLADLKFNETVIEDARSLNDCKADISIFRSSIQHISPTTIKSKKMAIHCIAKEYFIDLKSLFLKCNFPNLISFKINPEVYYDVYSFEDAFTYLPDSAPNLENISIEGKVRDLNFLTKFRYLISCGIFSIYDDMSLRYANITDRKESKRIFERNKYQYEITKILFPNLEDKFILADLEEHRILRLCHFLSTLSYTEEDLHLFTKNDVIRVLQEKKTVPNLEYYYECYYDALHHKKQPTELESLLNYEERYRFFGKYLCSYDPARAYYNQKTKQIVKSHPYLFAPNGLPIVFKENVKPIRTIDEARKKMSRVRQMKEDNLSQVFATFFKNISEGIEGEIFIEDLLFQISEEFPYPIKKEDFLAFGPIGKKIYYGMEAIERETQRIKDIQKKVEIYQNLLVDVIQKNYESLLVDEKAFLYYDKFNMKTFESKKELERYKQLCKNLLQNEQEVLQRINAKTNGFYSKYRDYINCFQKLSGYPSDICSTPLYPKELKQLTLHL